jgi:peptide chain release factor 2
MRGRRNGITGLGTNALCMYTRYAERHGFKVKLLDYLDGDEAGLKSATILIEGKKCFRVFKK